MVQYAAKIPDNIGKFTFVVTYNYDIKFRLKKQMKLALKWNKINNSLWTKCFSSSGRDGYHPGAPSSTAFKKNNRMDHKTCHDFNFSRCTRSVCRFPHKCNKCFKFGHNQRECFKQQSPGAPTLAATQRVNVPSSNPSMSGQTRTNASRSSQS